MEVGLPGALLWIAAVFSPLFVAWRRAAEIGPLTVGVVGGLVALLVNSVGTNAMLLAEHQLLLWILVVFLVAER